MPFLQFAKMYPDIAQTVPFYDKFISDPNYIVRIKNNRLEIGYTQDAWQIG